MTYLHCIVVSILQAMIEEIIFHFYEMFTITLPSFIHGGFILKIIQKVSSRLMDELIYFKQQLPNWKNFLQLNGLEHVKKKIPVLHNQRFSFLKDVHLLRCSSMSVCVARSQAGKLFCGQRGGDDPPPSQITRLFMRRESHN